MITNEAYHLDLRGYLEYKRGEATICACAVKNNGQKVDFAEIDVGGGPETGIQLGVALFFAVIKCMSVFRMYLRRVVATAGFFLANAYK